MIAFLESFLAFILTLFMVYVAILMLWIFLIGMPLLLLTQLFPHSPFVEKLAEIYIQIGDAITFQWRHNKPQ